MVVQRIGARIPVSRRRWWPASLCILALLVALLVAGVGLRHVRAQSDPPAQTNATASEKPPAALENSQADASSSSAKPHDSASPEQIRRRQVASECANLLKMATDLKAEVDKTTKDELSLAVVRKADEIEQFARKVRDDRQLSSGKN